MLVAQLCPTLCDLTDASPPQNFPLSTSFSRQEYWSGLPFPSPGHLSNPGIEPQSPTLQADFFYPLSHQGSLDAYKEGLGADVSKTETCSKHSPAPLEGHVGVCSEGGQGKQVRVWEGQSMDSDSLAIRQPRLTWPAIIGSLFPQVLPDWGLSLAPQAPDDCLSFRKSRGRACTWPLCALRNRSISAVLIFLQTLFFLETSRLPWFPLPGALPQRSGGSLPPLQVLAQASPQVLSEQPVQTHSCTPRPLPCLTRFPMIKWG